MSAFSRLAFLVGASAILYWCVNACNNSSANKEQASVLDSLVARLPKKNTVEIVNDSGFLIHVPDGKTVVSTKWESISKAELTDGDSLLILWKHNDNKQPILLDDYHSWEELILAIPENIKKNDNLKTFRENYFADLSCCKICGKIAVKDSQCISCGSENYDAYYKMVAELYENTGRKVDTESEFIKKQQLDWFTLFIKGDSVNFIYHDRLFKNCLNWSPRVTTEEVLLFQKKHGSY